MPYVARPFWNVSFGFIDNNDNVATCSTKLPGDLTLAEVETRVTALAAALQAVSDASVRDANISRTYVQDTPTPAVATSEVERKLIIPMGTDLEPNAVTMEVPSPVFSLEIDGTDVVNQATPSLVTLVGLLTAGALGPGDGSITYYGADITRSGPAYIAHRRRSRRR